MSQQMRNEINFLNKAVKNLTDRVAELEHRQEITEGKVNPIEIKVDKRKNGRTPKTQ